MKFLFRCLPTLAVLLVAFLLSSHAARTHRQAPLADEREKEAVRAQIRELSQRLQDMGADSHHALPRGGLTLRVAPQAISFPGS
jgi:hypothetical protein